MFCWELLLQCHFSYFDYYPFQCSMHYVFLAKKLAFSSILFLPFFSWSIFLRKYYIFLSISFLIALFPLQCIYPFANLLPCGVYFRWIFFILSGTYYYFWRIPAEYVYLLECIFQYISRSTYYFSHDFFSLEYLSPVLHFPILSSTACCCL